MSCRKLRAVILNDTRSERHFGCSIVMDHIGKKLGERGISVIASSAVRNDWQNDTTFLEYLNASDLILINGEGTCHHGNRHAENLLRVAEHPARRNIPVALINAIYQENPSLWGRYLEKIDIIWARDSWSAATLRKETGRDIPWNFDLSMATGLQPQIEKIDRDLVTVGESVLHGARCELMELARGNDLLFLPIVQTLKSAKQQYGDIYRVLRDIYIYIHRYLFKMRTGNVIFSRDRYEYISYLLRSILHITGRFHAACICVTALTPFVALKSNSWKIEALVSDLGISNDRVVDPSQLENVVAEPQTYAFSKNELESIKRGLAKAGTNAEQMFDEIRQAAIGGK